LYLPDETMRYVFRILALKEIFQHPRRYGFILEPTDYYPAINYQTITVSDPIPDFANFAIEHGTTYKMLKVYNPWLRSKQLKNTKHKSYDIKLPA
jgi:membrane-bound lytic murein transglycosylase D